MRLLKKGFYSKAPEEIQPNVYSTATPKRITADFFFTSGGKEYTLNYPVNSQNAEFRQFAVFDGKSVLKHLENKNQFEFRPSGLSFFSAYTEAVNKLETKLNGAITGKQNTNNFIDLFDGNSEIKLLISSLSGATKISLLEKYLPYSETDIKAKQEKQKKYDEILLVSRNKQKEIDALNNLKNLVAANKSAIVNLNRFFSEEHLNNTYNAISDCIEKEEKAKKEGVDKFTNDKIKNIGGQEWKNFINAAEIFAKKQTAGYPSDNDNCLLCHQPLSVEASALIQNYWLFIKSIAEKEAKDAQELINNGIIAFEKLSFDLFPENNILTNWMKEANPAILEKLKNVFEKQESLSTEIIENLRNKKINKKVMPLQVSIEDHLQLEKNIDAKLLVLTDNKPDPDFEKLGNELTLLTHREKLSLHFDKIKQFIEDQQWILKANKANWGKRNITDAEKILSGKYFNQKYIDTFNDECDKMNGSFGISISHTGAAGTSYRQLFIQGKNPAAILSEGEQKVIAIADFVAEMSLSEANRGIIFDDPVTSLDHERKETIAKHLTEVALEKQVVVFTHDIFFLLSLKYHAEAASINLHSCSLYKNEDLVGVTKPSLPWIASNVKERCGYLKNELQRITKLHRTADPDAYKVEVKTWCGYLREAWERSVEERLFKGVVTRFTPGIETQKLKYLAITDELIGDIAKGMTETSKWVHDQASGANVPTPKPDELQKMIDEFEVFITTKCKPQ